MKLGRIRAAPVTFPPQEKYPDRQSHAFRDTVRPENSPLSLVLRGVLSAANQVLLLLAAFAIVAAGAALLRGKPVAATAGA